MIRIWLVLVSTVLGAVAGLAGYTAWLLDCRSLPVVAMGWGRRLCWFGCRTCRGLATLT
jgi:hypothetical protein